MDPHISDPRFITVYKIIFKLEIVITTAAPVNTHWLHPAGLQLCVILRNIYQYINASMGYLTQTISCQIN